MYKDGVRVRRGSAVLREESREFTAVPCGGFSLFITRRKLRKEKTPRAGNEAAETELGGAQW